MKLPPGAGAVKSKPSERVCETVSPETSAPLTVATCAPSLPGELPGMVSVHTKVVPPEVPLVSAGCALDPAKVQVGADEVGLLNTAVSVAAPPSLRAVLLEVS